MALLIGGVSSPGIGQAQTAQITKGNTESEAYAQAEATGQPVQIDPLTTKELAVFANPDGTATAKLAAGPVREPDPTSPSGWSPIDLSLHSTDQASSRP